MASRELGMRRSRFAAKRVKVITISVYTLRQRDARGPERKGTVQRTSEAATACAFRCGRDARRCTEKSLLSAHSQEKVLLFGSQKHPITHCKLHGRMIYSMRSAIKRHTEPHECASLRVFNPDESKNSRATA